MGSVRFARASVVVALAATVAACQWILGIEDRAAAPVDASAPDGPGDGDGGPGDRDADAAPEASCEAGLRACGTSCVDVARDPRHCGGCDHACIDAGCEAGLCPLEPLFVDIPSYIANGMAFAGNTRAFAYSRGYNADPGSGSFVTVIARADGGAVDALTLPKFQNINDIEADEDAFYFAADGVVYRWDLATRALTTIADDGVHAYDTIKSIFVRGDDVFYRYQTEARRVKKDGSQNVRLIALPPAGPAVAASTGYAYVNDNTTGKVTQIDVATRALSDLANGPVGVGVSTFSDGRLFLATGTNVHAYDEATRASAFYFGASGLRAIRDVREKDGFLYAFDAVEAAAPAPPAGRIVRARVDAPDEPPVEIARGIGRAVGIYLDDDYVYFAEHPREGGPRVVRVAR